MLSFGHLLFSMSDLLRLGVVVVNFTIPFSNAPLLLLQPLISDSFPLLEFIKFSDRKIPIGLLFVNLLDTIPGDVFLLLLQVF